MRTRLGKSMIVGTIAMAVAVLYSMKADSIRISTLVCKGRPTENTEKIIKSALPIWEAVTRHMIRM